MKDLKTYTLIVLTFLVIQEQSSLQANDMGYSEYGSVPSTDWSMANPYRTTPEPMFGRKTKADKDDDDYYYADDSDTDSSLPKVVLAQGKHVMISIPGYDQCGAFDAYEDERKDGQEKKCIAAGKPFYFWISYFTPEETHSILVYDRSGTKLLSTTFTSLPSLPPDITYNYIESGAGWIMVKVKVVEEAAPSLVGVEVLYKREDDKFWWRSYAESVSYKEFRPRVVPVHYCPDFVEDGTFCLLLSDGAWIKDDKEKNVKYEFKISAFRIGPEGRGFGPATDEVHTYRYCDWLQMNCNPPMGSSEEYTIYGDDDSAGLMDNATIGSSDVSGGAGETGGEGGAGDGGPGAASGPGGSAAAAASPTSTLPPFLLSTTWAPEMWIENVTKPRPEVLVEGSDLWVVYLALLIILISILLPLAFWLGTRAGYHEAEGYWTELSSTGGNVNISLGYVGTEWTRPVKDMNVQHRSTVA